MKVRECFLQAVSIVEAGDDARAAWVSMNRKNAPGVLELARAKAALSG